MTIADSFVWHYSIVDTLRGQLYITEDAQPRRDRPTSPGVEEPVFRESTREKVYLAERLSV